MVELKTRFSKVGNLYIPKEIREAFGSEEIRIIPNASASVFFAKNTSYEDVLKSLDIIAADIKHRIELQKKQENGGD